MNERIIGDGTGWVFPESKAGFNPNQRRDKLGKWTSGGVTLSDFENEIQDEDVENGAIFDEDGNMLVRIETGNEDTLRLTDEDAKFLKGNIMTHNHPLQYGDAKGTSLLSYQDVAMHIIHGSTATRAVTGEWYHEITSDYDDILEEIYGGSRDDMMQDLEHAVNNSMNYATNKIEFHLAFEGSMSKAEINKLGGESFANYFDNNSIMADYVTFKHGKR